eukprot:213604-Chlamydomonas_euryale.AAC.41
MCAAAGVPQLMHILNAARLMSLGQVARMPAGSVVEQLFFAQLSRPGWQGGAGMGWPRTAHSGVPFVTVPSPLFDPLWTAALNTGIPLVGMLPVTLTLSLTGEPKPQSHMLIRSMAHNRISA